MANIRKGNLQAFENILQPIYFVSIVLFVAIPIAVFGIIAAAFYPPACTTGLTSVPSPSISTSTVSPAFR